jgi:radical SAM superfamily enzyme YgiQ (UPF0313 family)
MVEQGQALLIQPWIDDFAAYNLWIEPLGLLTIGAALAESGYGVTVIDCLAPHAGCPPPRADGASKLLKTGLDKPGAVSFVPRRYGRYGLPVEAFEAALRQAPAPDVVLVASGMTYWYPAVADAIRRVRRRFGGVPVAVGGVYASLCPEHARAHSGADWVIAGPGLPAALRLADEASGRHSQPERYEDPRSWPAPAHGGVERPFAALITSWGCPFDCTYCASRRLHPAFVQRRPAAVVEEIAACARRGLRDLAFYDDALLVGAEEHLVPILEGVARLGLPLRFHTPNGLHARLMTPELARQLRQAGLVTAWLSLETVDAARQQASGGKVSGQDLERAVACLRAAGFGRREVGAYLLAGLPGQPLAEVEASVRYVQGLGLLAKVSLFSPIPGTPDGDRALPAGADPLLHNPTVYPYLRGAGFVEELQRVQRLAQEGNRQT